MLTITHNHAEGTQIDGTRRGDGTNEILKATGWRWSRTPGSWYLPHTRDHAPKTWAIDNTARALETAGHQVATQIDDQARPTADVEADKIARQDERADRLADKAAQVADAADGANQAAHELAGRVPFGQPILVGHHSEGRMRQHYQQVENTQRRAVDLSREADTAAEKARAAAHTTAARYNPVTVGNRIEKIEAETREAHRELDGYTRVYFVDAAGTKHGDTFPPATGARRNQLTARLDELADQLTYWRQIHADQITAGAATNYGPDSIAKGDQVKIRGRWYPVVRVNKKTVSIPSIVGGSWTDTAPYREIQEHRPAATTD